MVFLFFTKKGVGQEEMERLNVFSRLIFFLFFSFFCFFLGFCLCFVPLFNVLSRTLSNVLIYNNAFATIFTHSFCAMLIVRSFFLFLRGSANRPHPFFLFRFHRGRCYGPDLGVVQISFEISITPEK